MLRVFGGPEGNLKFCVPNLPGFGGDRPGGVHQLREYFLQGLCIPTLLVPNKSVPAVHNEETEPDCAQHPARKSVPVLRVPKRTKVRRTTFPQLRGPNAKEEAGGKAGGVREAEPISLERK